MFNKQKKIYFSLLTLAVSAIVVSGCDSDSKIYDSSYHEAPKSSFQIDDLYLSDIEGQKIENLEQQGGYLNIRVLDNNSSPVSGALVVFSSQDQGVQLLQTTSGKVQTDSEGKARIAIKPIDFSVNGSFVVSVEVSNNEEVIQDKIIFSVKPDNLQLSDVSINSKTIPSAGQVSFSLNVTTSDGKPVAKIPATAVTSCGDVSLSNTSDTSGKYEGVYNAVQNTGGKKILCEGETKVTVQLNSDIKKTFNLKIEGPTPTSIVYNNQKPLNLGVVGSGSATSSEVKFTVFSKSVPLSNEEVRLSLKRSPAGVSLGTKNNVEDVVLKTDSNGEVSLNIYSGNTPGPIEIEASLLNDPEILTFSKNISVSQSRVTQDSFSVALEQKAISWDKDGNSVDIGVYLADRNGNPAPDGTVVSFTSEGGQIEPNCSSLKGACSVKLKVQNPRPLDGRVSVLAFVEGEKSYLDVNKNNSWDPEFDTIMNNIGDAFRDDNENDTFDEGEFIYTVKSNSAPSECGDYKANAYPNLEGTCNKGLDGVLRKQLIALMSSDKAHIKGEYDEYGSIIDISVNSKKYPLNPMPFGSKISVEIMDNTDNEENCAAVKVSGDETITNNHTTNKNVNIGNKYKYKFVECSPQDVFIFNVVSPNQISTSFVHVF